MRKQAIQVQLFIDDVEAEREGLIAMGPPHVYQPQMQAHSLRDNLIAGLHHKLSNLRTEVAHCYDLHSSEVQSLNAHQVTQVFRRDLIGKAIRIGHLDYATSFFILSNLILSYLILSETCDQLMVFLTNTTHVLHMVITSPGTVKHVTRV